jgi:hypothetical protein
VETALIATTVMPAENSTEITPMAESLAGLAASNAAAQTHRLKRLKKR